MLVDKIIVHVTDTNTKKRDVEILGKKFTSLDNFIVTFQEGAVAPKTITMKAKEEPKIETKPVQSSTTSKSVTPVTVATPSKLADIGSEYNEAEPLPTIKPSTTATNHAPAIQISKTSLVTDAKISFVFSAILEHFNDIWISKKSDGSFSVEEMDGPICVFHLKEGNKINFTADSFKNLNPRIKLAIQKKFIELSKLI